MSERPPLKTEKEILDWIRTTRIKANEEPFASQLAQEDVLGYLVGACTFLKYYRTSLTDTEFIAFTVELTKALFILGYETAWEKRYD